MNYPEDFASAPLDLEINFGDKGGIQRFKTVGDIQIWLNEEQGFWNWTRQVSGRHRDMIGNTITEFWKYDQNCRSHLDAANNRWNQVQQEVRQIREQISKLADQDNQSEALGQQLDQRVIALTSVLNQLRDQISSFLTSEVISGRNHLTRFEPQSEFINELAAQNLEEAIFALDQIIQKEKKSNDQRSCEHAGRMMASLYLRNLNRKFRPDQKAFENAIVTWSKELADFKSRYEAQEQEFAAISGRHGVADETWQQRADTLVEEFSEMRLQSERDLKNLKDTYETHMQLHGPLTYWRGKRKEHRDQIKSLRRWAIITGVLGCAALFVAAWLVLPENHPAATIPWRQIGFFVLTSTFVLWLVKLLVKLLLSHIHLYADAKEREVMISTFMALIRRPESAQNLKREDIAIVLAPIFKPSTTGVIKDDGGPTSLGDFIGRLSGK